MTAMGNYSVMPLQVGSVLRPRDRSIPNPPLFEDPITIFYVEGEGHKILVDTGGREPDGRWAPYMRSPQQRPDAAVRALGVAPEEIDTILITHLHWDHCANSHLFPNARVYVQEREYAYLMSAQGQASPAVDAESAGLVSYELVDGDCDLLPGLRLLLAPAHSPGLQCVRIDTNSGQFLVLSDIATHYEAWEGETRQYPPIYDEEQFRRFLAQVDDPELKVLPQHDMRVFERYGAGIR